MTARDDILVARDLRGGYGAAKVLHGVSLHARRGSVTALLGANGAGKTTLMRMLCGLVHADTGSIEFDGADITGYTTSARVTAGIALSPEGRMVFPSLTVEENLSLGAISGRSWGSRRSQIRAAYDLFPRLFERRRQAAGSLSGGEQTMLAVGRALMSKPSLLLLDEPTLGLAPVIVDAVFETVAKLAAQDLTMVISEQNVRRTLEMADYAYVLENGQIRAEGKGSDLVNDDAVKHAYLGQ